MFRGQFVLFLLYVIKDFRLLTSVSLLVHVVTSKHVIDHKNNFKTKLYNST